MNAVAEAFIGDQYKENLVALRKIAVATDQVVFGIDYDQASREVGHNVKARSGIMITARLADSEKTMEELGMEKEQAESTDLASTVARKLNGISEADKQLLQGYIGYATAFSFMVPVADRYVKTMFISTEAILELYQQMGLGAKFLEIANILYKPHVIAFRSRSGRMVGSVVRSELIDAESIYPRYRRADREREMAEIRAGLESRTINPKGVDPETWIAEGVYPEGWDRAYTPDPTHKSYEWDVWMEEAGLKAEEGNGMFFAADSIGRFRETVAEELVAN